MAGSTLTSTDLSLSVHSSAPTTSPLSPPTVSKTSFKIGTRTSTLALAQTHILISLLTPLFPTHSFPIAASSTSGDRNQTTALHAFNAKSLWTEDLETLLLSGETDLIAHSLKDMPTQLPRGCALGAAVNRVEKRDCVVMAPWCRERGWKGLGDLEGGSVVGTSSVRRIAQVRRLFPGLVIEDVRGNVGTRLRKLDAVDDNSREGEGKGKGRGKYAALILAATGLQRVGEGERVSSFLSWEEGGWLGAVGQGAVGVEVRSGDEEVGALCEAIMKDGEGGGKKLWFEALAERMLLRTLEGGCSVPVGVETQWEGEEMGMRAMVMSVDGQQEVRGYKKYKIGSREEAEAAGLDMASDLIEKGAEKILGEITLNRKIIEESGGA